MAAAQILYNRRAIASESIEQKLKNIGSLLGIELPIRKAFKRFIRKEDKLQLETEQTEWFNTVLDLIEQKLIPCNSESETKSRKRGAK